MVRTARKGPALGSRRRPRAVAGRRRRRRHSDSSIPFAEDVQRQGRGIFAIASIAGGVAAAGLLSGLGAIVSMMVSDRKAALPAEPADSPPAGPEGP